MLEDASGSASMYHLPLRDLLDATARDQPYSPWKAADLSPSKAEPVPRFTSRHDEVRGGGDRGYSKQGTHVGFVQEQPRDRPGFTAPLQDNPHPAAALMQAFAGRPPPEEFSRCAYLADGVS